MPWPAMACTSRANRRRSSAGSPHLSSMACLAWCTAPAGTGVVPPQQGAERCEIVRQAPEGCGLPRPRWRLADLRAVVPWLRTYRLSGIRQALTRLGVRRTRGRFALHSPDPDEQPKLAAIDQAVARARAPPDRVLYADELTLVRRPPLGRWRSSQPALVVRPGVYPRARSEEHTSEL